MLRKRRLKDANTIFINFPHLGIYPKFLYIFRKMDKHNP